MKVVENVLSSGVIEKRTYDEDGKLVNIDRVQPVDALFFVVSKRPRFLSRKSPHTFSKNE